MFPTEWWDSASGEKGSGSLPGGRVRFDPYGAVEAERALDIVYRPNRIVRPWRLDRVCP